MSGLGPGLRNTVLQVRKGVRMQWVTHHMHPSVLDSWRAGFTILSWGEMSVIHLVTDVGNQHLRLCWAGEGPRRWEGKDNGSSPYLSMLI